MVLYVEVVVLVVCCCGVAPLGEATPASSHSPYRHPQSSPTRITQCK